MASIMKAVTPLPGLVFWYTWKGTNFSAKRAEMKIRPVDFSNAPETGPLI